MLLAWRKCRQNEYDNDDKTIEVAVNERGRVVKLSKKNAARQSAISRALASGKGLGGLLVGIATAVVGGCSERSPSTVMGDYPAPQQLNTERETRDASVMGKMILKDDKSQNCTTNAVNEFESEAEGGIVEVIEE